MEGEEPIEAEGTEVLEAEPKNILLSLLSQLSLGMDLSRVTLPTFILEPKSFLEKLTDFMTHPDLVLNASSLETPYDRLKALTRWYMSGFYIRPKGVKKPYNPILGEIFRASWDHGDSKSFYVSEQVSHHPPVSAFYGSNRPAGFVLNGSIFFKSKFGGNTVAAILDGHATIYMLNYDETYVLTFPTAYARGILWGTLLMELGGNVSIKCEQSEMRSEIEFKTKGFFGGDYNQVAGKIIHKKKTLYTFNGKWDKQLTGKGHKDKKEEVFWDPYGGMSQSNLKMNVRPISEQEDFESRKLWQGVSKGLIANDQEAATDAKCAIEGAQRQAVKDREEKGIVYEPRYFKLNEEGEWEYKWFDLTKWDAQDCAAKEEYEEDGEIKVRAK
eukprot:TRINITY_DN499_c0_g1_i2.p1 TRINITY_DN499_c0_g1~~TRINITY_DN499_c0_g1_i2.p1  ORF type:complete len:385 (-),score=80.36 TRINITY_DN499_c0_g1_i2:134-1288(-)